MNRIQTNILYFDLLERIDNALQQGRLNADVVRKLKSRPRIFYAINEAVLFFASRAQVPLNALDGFIARKLYKLFPSKTQNPYKGLAVYRWPDTANRNRPDAGLIRLSLDGRVFEPELTLEPTRLSLRLISLQNQAENTLMYGKGHHNAVVDLPGLQIYVPENVQPSAQILENPDPVVTGDFARGKAVITVTGKPTAAGTITITNVTAGEAATAEMTGDEDLEDVAQKIADAVDAASAVKVQAVFFADEVRLFSAVQGPAGFADVELDAGDSGVTFDRDEAQLNPEETKEIPIDTANQELIATSAFNHLLTNVASIGQPQAAPAEEETRE